MRSSQGDRSSHNAANTGKKFFVAGFRAAFAGAFFFAGFLAVGIIATQYIWHDDTELYWRLISNHFFIRGKYAPACEVSVVRLSLRPFSFCRRTAAGCYSYKRPAPQFGGRLQEWPGLVVRHGQVQMRDGRGRIDGVPAATLGSLWIATNSPGVALEEVVAFHHTEMVAANVARAPGLLTLLLPNVGKTVTVTRDGKPFTGAT